MFKNIDRGSLLESLFLIGLAILGLREGVRLLKVPLLFVDIIGPGWYIFFVSVLLLMSALVYSWGYFKRPGISKDKHFLLHLGPPGRITAIFGLYIIIVPFIGYAIGSMIFFILVFHASGMRSWVWSILIGIGVALAFKFCFSYLAGIPLH